MRSVLVLLAAAFTALPARAGTINYADPNYGADYDQLSAQDDLAAGPRMDAQRVQVLVHRSIGLDGLAGKLGVDHSQIKFYEYTSHPGTSAESKVTVGFGGRGVRFRMDW